MPHLVVSISGHGFGHVAQTAPVLNRLHRLLPQLRITVRSNVPLTHLRARIHAAYRAFHADWETRIDATTAPLGLPDCITWTRISPLKSIGVNHANREYP